MSHTYQQYKLIFGSKNPISLAFAGQYFLSLFSEHPVAISIAYVRPSGSAPPS